MTVRSEFEIITQLFKPMAGSSSLDLKDDAALFTPPAGLNMVVTQDALIEGVHFLPTDPAWSVAKKLIRVNLSDLAAMGADPSGVVLSLCMGPLADAAWLDEFAQGFHEDLSRFEIELVGGDTTAGPGPVVLSLTAYGWVPEGAALLRSGAAPGDVLCVTGPIGDGALGLKAAQGMVTGLDQAAVEATRKHYRMPVPQVAAGRALRGLASAAIDVSDGLMADAGHLCQASQVGAIIRMDSVPMSDALKQAAAEDSSWRLKAVTGGDDYQLLVSIPPNKMPGAQAALTGTGAVLSEIGTVMLGSAVALVDADGEALDIPKAGYEHQVA